MIVLNDPTQIRLSPHFLLSDFMGCFSVYRHGYPNVFEMSAPDYRLENGRALCREVLEPVLALSGPISISYGFISPELSRQIVKYQDPDKPSHHRWDLGAAADICVHDWVQTLAPGSVGTTGAPIEFALSHMQEMQISRLITYSESPYFCVAVSAEEVERSDPRMAWYENRYGGEPKVKPEFRKMASAVSRKVALEVLKKRGQEVDWRGAGYPTHHGGGIRQYQHTRTSRYTMLSDWLFDVEYVARGVPNIPRMANPLVREAFELAGMAYDSLIASSGLPRLSIVSAYTSPEAANAPWVEGRDWLGKTITFEVVPPEYVSPSEAGLEIWPIEGGFMEISEDRDRLIVKVDRENAKKYQKTQSTRLLATGRATDRRRPRVSRG